MHKLSILLALVLLPIFAFAQKKTSLSDVFKQTQLTTINGDTTSFAEMLAAHKGKVLYVDFWASWCGPCKREMPASKRLHEQLKNNDVEFIYLSLDKQKKLWKRSVNQFKLEQLGHNYRGAQNEILPLLRYLRIYSIPHYIIFGKDGKMLNPSAPAPSDRNTLKTLQKLASDK